MDRRKTKRPVGLEQRQLTTSPFPRSRIDVYLGGGGMDTEYVLFFGVVPGNLEPGTWKRVLTSKVLRLRASQTRSGGAVPPTPATALGNLGSMVRTASCLD